MAKPDKPTIAIIGGGLAGLTLNIGFTRQGIPHNIYESAAAFSEVGAGIALGPNSITALELIDPRIKDILRKCVTYNEGVDEDGNGERSEEWLDIRMGEGNRYHMAIRLIIPCSFGDLITTIRHTGTPKPGRACVHRAKFLDELIKLIPRSTASFGKSLTSISEVPSTGQLCLSFTDGSTATASAVIACDGIKSIARQQNVLSGEPDQRVRRPVSANDFAYRCMFPQDLFVHITEGTIDAGKGTLFCGPDSYVVMYPVEKRSLMNMVAVKHIPTTSQDSDLVILQEDSNWIQPVASETMLSDFTSWGKPIKALLSNIKCPERWALYEHLPAPTYIKGRVALLGDAAHANTPHQGQGAGMAFEDSLILSSILGQILDEFEEPISHGSDETELNDLNMRLECALIAYDEVRRPRTQDDTRTSREMGDLVGFAAEGIQRDLVKMKENLDARMNWIWDVDLLEEVRRGVEIARNPLKAVP